MLTICLFGKFHVEGDQGSFAHMPGGKLQELLCYLLLNRGMHSREALATLLWPECEPLKSKKHLRQVLWQLQRALGHTPLLNGSHPLCNNSDAVRINENSPLRVDVEQFEKAYRSLRSIRAENLDPEQAKDLHAAVLLYRGDLLEGCYQDWCVMERERLQNCYLAILDKLILYSEKQKEYQLGIEYGERILAIDRAHERSHQHLMRLHYLNENRTAALRQYDRCKAALFEELGVNPSRQSVKLYEQIRADSRLLDGVPGPSVNEQDSAQVLFYLQNLMTRIGELQTELKKQIRSAQPADKSGRKMA